MPVWNHSIGDVLDYVHQQGVCQEFSAAVAGSLAMVFCPDPLVKGAGSLSPRHFSSKEASFFPLSKQKPMCCLVIVNINMESCLSDHPRQNLAQKRLTMVCGGTLMSEPSHTLPVG